MRLLELRDLFGRRIGSEHNPGRGARTGARQREQRKADEEQRADRGDDAACDEAKHGGLAQTLISPGAMVRPWLTFTSCSACRQRLEAWT